MFGTVGRMMGSLLIFTIFLTLSVSGDSKLGDGTNKGQSMNFINKDFKNQYESQFTDDFKTVAVQIDKRSLHEVEEIAQQHGYKNLGQIGTLDGYYEFEHVHNRRTKRAALNRLQRDTRVKIPSSLILNIMCTVSASAQCTSLFLQCTILLFPGTMV